MVPDVITLSYSADGVAPAAAEEMRKITLTPGGSEFVSTKFLTGLTPKKTRISFQVKKAKATSQSLGTRRSYATIQIDGDVLNPLGQTVNAGKYLKIESSYPVGASQLGGIKSLLIALIQSDTFDRVFVNQEV